MYQVEFLATDSEDWAEAIEFYDASDSCENTDLVPPDAEFELVLRDNRYPVLTAKTEDGTLIRNSQTVISWRFPVDRMRSLCPGNTYAVGLTMTTTTGTEQVLVGTLSFIDGIVK